MRKARIKVANLVAVYHCIIRIVGEDLERGGRIPRKIRERLLRRMGDVSAFMKELKQRFSRLYNRSHDRFGTLWAERFKSVLVEDNSEALRTVAAYIDLNSLRRDSAASGRSWKAVIPRLLSLGARFSGRTAPA